MKVSLKLIYAAVIVLNLLLVVDCGKGKGGGVGGVANVGKAISKKGGIGKKVGAAAVVVGSGAAGYIAYKGIKKAVKHGRGDDSSEEYNDYYGRNRDYGRNQYYGSGIRISAWNPNFLILWATVLGAIRWYC